MFTLCGYPYLAALQSPQEQTEEKWVVFGTAGIKAGWPRCVCSQMLCIVVLSANTGGQSREPGAGTASFLAPICLCICYLGHKELCKPGIRAVNLK